MINLLLAIAVLVVTCIYCVTCISLISFYVRKSLRTVEILRYSSPDVCMCGADMSYSSHWNENHGPISEYDHYSRKIDEMKIDVFWIKT